MGWTDRADERDPGRCPVPATAPVESAPDTNRNRPVLVAGRDDNNRLDEIGCVFVNPDESWKAGNGAIVQFDSNTETRVLLTAMKTCGLIVADNGSNGHLSGAPDKRWNNDALTSEPGQVQASHFEVVRMDGLVAG